MNYIDYAKEAISLYPITNPEIEYIRHNENMTFKVIDVIDNKSYILRIHKPATEGFLGIQHSYEGLKSEVELLNAINVNKELKVQKPIQNSLGDYVSEYNSASLGKCYVTLLEWIDGDMLTLKEEGLEDIAFSIGEKLGVLHKLFSEFKPKEGFKRPKYNIERIDTTIEELKYGVDINLFTKENYDIIREVLFVVKERLIVLETQGDAWGIIHADVLPGNIVINNGQASFIDFCLSGFGYYLFDLGSAATIFEEKNLREAVLQGYASKMKFSYDNLRDVESLIFMDIFVSYLFFIKDDNRNKWIKDQVEKLCAGSCKDFLEGKEVFFSL